ncbi:unnamed protein product, partial [Ilex paraguariensis]
AYDRAAIKFRGVEADINFSLDYYDEDLKQVGKELVKDMNQALENHGVNMRVSTLLDDTIGDLAGGRYYNRDSVAAVTMGMGTNAAYVEPAQSVSNIIVLVRVFFVWVSKLILSNPSIYNIMSFLITITGLYMVRTLFLMASSIFFFFFCSFVQLFPFLHLGIWLCNVFIDDDC